MLKNLDIVYCSSDDCVNETCERNQNFNVDWTLVSGNFGVAILEEDFWKECPEYLPIVDDPEEYEDDYAY